MNAERSSTDSTNTFFARNVLSMAAQVEAAETRIKIALLTAACAGDCQTVIDITNRWMTEPVETVASTLPPHLLVKAKTSLDPGPGSEVSVAITGTGIPVPSKEP